MTLPARISAKMKQALQVIEATPSDSLDEVLLNPEALLKAKLYANLVSLLVQEGAETYGYLTTDKNDPGRVVRDVYLADDQEVSGGHVEVSAAGVLAASREIMLRRNQRILGWWHSHGHHSTFHSGTDRDNHKNVLVGIGSSNYVSRYQSLDLILDANTKVLRSATDPLVEVVASGGDFSSELAYSLKTGTKIGFAYSVVVNLGSAEPYGELAQQRYCRGCGKGEYTAKKVDIRVVSETPSLCNVSDEIVSMAREVRAKVRSRGSLTRRIYAALAVDSPTPHLESKVSDLNNCVEPVPESNSLATDCIDTGTKLEINMTPPLPSTNPIHPVPEYNCNSLIVNQNEGECGLLSYDVVELWSIFCNYITEGCKRAKARLWQKRVR